MPKYVFASPCIFLPVAGGLTDFVVSSAVAPGDTPENKNVTDGKVYKYFAQSSDGSVWEQGSGAYTIATHTLARTTISSSSGVGKIDFASPPEVTVFPSKPSVLEIVTPDPPHVIKKTRNYLINGAMMVSQENGTSAGTTTGYYPVDMFDVTFSNGGTISIAQVASVTPKGSPNRLRVTVTAADAAVAAGDFLRIGQRIEGLLAADLLLGTASAKALAIPFGVRAPAGTYCVVATNSATNRSYVAEYTIAGGEANTDVVKSVIIPGDTSGTWLTTNGIGLDVRWGLMAGSTFQQAAGSWGTGNVHGSSNQFNLMGTNGNVFELFDVGCYDYDGVEIPAFQVPEYAQELRSGMRYYEKLDGAIVDTNSTGSFTGGGHWAFKVRKRATPTMTGASGSVGIVSTGLDGSSANTTSGAQAGFSNGATANARL